MNTETLSLDEQQFDCCSVCDMDPTLDRNRGAQVYICDDCDALVCSTCSENDPRDGTKVLCLACLAVRT